MAGVRRALIVAIDEYADPGLGELRAPEHDAAALASALEDPAVGDFRVETAVNKPTHEVIRAVARFFKAGGHGDVLLVHFSCPGVKSDTGQLYFAATDTSLDLLEATAVSSTFVNDAMQSSRAGTVLLLLDCCYSGAFGRGMTPRAGDSVDVGDRLGGTGRAVITASSAIQYAFEDGTLADNDEDDRPSIFTKAVVTGLETGDADRDLDGQVTLNEFYTYVHDAVVRVNPKQTPKFFAHDVEGDLLIANRSTPVTTPSPLPQSVVDTLASDDVLYRRVAVEELSEMLAEHHPGRALAARLRLQELASTDDSNTVRTKAKAALTTAAIETSADVETEHRPSPSVEPRSKEPIGAKIKAEDERSSEPESELGTEADEDDGSDDTNGWRRAWLPLAGGLAVLAVIALIVVVLWPSNENAGERSHSGATVPTLSDDELLLTAKSNGGWQLVKFNTATKAKPEIVIDNPNAVLPTVSDDRQWMVYQKRQGEYGAPYLARVDGTDDAPLLNPRASRECPFTNRPAWSPDGGYLTLVCMDDSGQPTGLWTVNRDGKLLHELVDSDSVVGSPTWGGDGYIYYMEQLDNDADHTVLKRIHDDGSGQPEAIPTSNGVDGWDSHPDWSNEGILFLRSGDGGESGRLCVLELDLRLRDCSDESGIESPTWGPNERSAVWIQPSAGAREAILWWVPDLQGEPEQLLSGDLGPPAWGSR